MSINVSIHTNKGEPAAVMGADKLCSCTPFEWYLTQLIHSDHDYNTLFDMLVFKMLRENHDKVSFTYGHKLLVSPDMQSALVFSSSYHSSPPVRDLLFEPDKFFSNNALMKRLFFPITVPKNAEKIIQTYGSSFNIGQCLHSRYIPEIRRLVELESVQTKEDLINGKPEISYAAERLGIFFKYTFSSARIIDPSRHRPWLIEIASTGALDFAGIVISGSGSNVALNHLYKEKILDKYGSLSKDITLQRAIDVVQSTIAYVNTQNPYCDGFEYAIIRESGIESHLNESEGSRTEYPLSNIIVDRKNYLSQCGHRLRNIEKYYHSLKNTYDPSRSK